MSTITQGQPHQIQVHTTTHRYETGVTPQRYEAGVNTSLYPEKGLIYPERGPSTSQVLAVLAGLPVGGILLLLAGLTLAGTLTGLAVTTPLFILFSPVLVPATIVIGLAVAGFLTSGACGLTALSSFSWVLNYIRETQGTVPEQWEAAKHHMVDAASAAKHHMADAAGYVGQKTKEVGQKTKEVGQDIQNKAQDAKVQDAKRTSATSTTTTTATA
ncbi:hypothetical protein RJT34_16291 [Clitoria ternatea]|uniref:Oleosin n=1 Tax=Clitoria ternatea TaxID=43366 RepID=A0AAN9J877_CLITE